MLNVPIFLVGGFIAVSIKKLIENKNLQNKPNSDNTKKEQGGANAVIDNQNSNSSGDNGDNNGLSDKATGKEKHTLNEEIQNVD